ncbi:MAG: hypothetical protein JST28_21930 [Acidobacteria bacterium]|nr:hypothetical protein [Acidobacteriota bacterium]
MSKDVLSFLGIGLLTGLFAVATIIGTAMRLDKDPAVDGPRALIAEFFGLWFAFAFLAFSFMVENSTTQWVFRGVAASAALIGFVFAAFFAGTPEVRVRLDQEPTGFDAPITALELNQPSSQKATPITESRSRS